MDENLKKLIPYTKKYKTNIIWNVTFNVLYALFGTLGMVLVFPVLNVLFSDGEKVTSLPKFDGIMEIGNYAKQTLFYYITKLNQTKGLNYSLLLTISLLITTFLFKNLFNFLGLQHLMKLKSGVLRDLRNKMYHKIVELPVSYYSEKRKGDVMARMLGDVNEVQNSFFAVLELIVKEPLTIIFSLIAMFNISWKLTLFVFIFIPVSGLLISKIGKSLKGQSIRAQRENGFMISIVEETLSGLKVIKAFNSESFFSTIFTGSTERLYVLTNKIGKKNNLASPLSEFLGIVVIAVLLFYGGNLVLVDGSLTGSLFLAYIGLAYNILTPAKAISKAVYQVKNGVAAAERVFEILDTPNVIMDSPASKDISGFENAISIKNVTFAYEEQKVLKDFSLEIPKGKTIALVGQSGSGKSTIANLLLRFYDISAGSIAVDGVELKDIKLHPMRELFGLVTQDSIMFNGTIADNIRIGKENATNEEIYNALKIANALEFVEHLPLGIDTNIGDSGSKLSGGQRQRLSIARAVLKNPPIMILDEATSALDTESERLVQQALENMMQNRTSVVIAHRLSTIQKADLIVVMQKGRIVEQGTHDELIALGGTYHKLVMMQSFE
ncbi:antibiotic ABC transporter ATP-binding protein [Flavobacterium rivuli WB 3.3-2 = DSM 21788]|uniref:Antibiotic ABC transporter ATP-binding protein n=1 Tax=Flavobacterium rivuli WB 3.3-2 = DSM 21788 TaxID=1121895 RepID=A0A0A2M4G7_9FLAO|nr:ABC transporter ATP-binding protein [Flavobacterium rivuli]KGO87547.1 antibiotic ABC transporter ATP-binding protein [Flavobacterium rivuli WB 3.3-2 = DSM 21788]